MKLEGSCHCGDVRFSLNAKHPYPFNYCYCSICRKTAGGGGYAINLGADNASLQVQGEDNLSVYQAGDSPARRHFCQTCGSALWVWDPRWPELVHPFASAIDTDLPISPEYTHLMVDSKASWVEIRKAKHDKVFGEYPDESVAEWHQRLGLNSKR
jgi:hypothetical protein